MYERELITVIVPVYKVEKYLYSCIDSIVNQTYRNLEIILVEDGSPDACPRLCDEWGAKDHRIMVIHIQNGGASNARNVGLNSSSGNFICFVDSDDILHHGYIESLYKLAKDYNAEIAKCGYMKFSSGIPSRNEEINEEVRVINCQEELMANPYLAGVVWNKLYDRKIFDKIRFPVGKKCEDIAVSYRIYDTAERLVETNQIYYYYRQHQESVMGGNKMDTSLDLLEVLKENYLYFSTINQQVANNILLFHVITVPSIYVKHLRKEFSNELHNTLKSELKLDLMELKRSKRINNTLYLKYKLYAANLFMYGRIKRFWVNMGEYKRKRV